MHEKSFRFFNGKQVNFTLRLLLLLLLKLGGNFACFFHDYKTFITSARGFGGAPELYPLLPLQTEKDDTSTVVVEGYDDGAAQRGYLTNSLVNMHSSLKFCSHSLGYLRILTNM